MAQDGILNPYKFHNTLTRLSNKINYDEIIRRRLIYAVMVHYLFKGFILCARFGKCQRTGKLQANYKP